VLQVASAFGALFTAVFILLTGNGLLNTLLSARMAAEGFSMATTGLVFSCYFMGLLAGSFVCHHPIQRVGHIRAFTIFAAGTTAAALLHALHVSPLYWGVLRFSCGVTIFGLYMVIESWLNECTEPRYRGRVFAVYMTLSYLGIGVGQHLLGAAPIQGQELFIIAGIIFAICLVPVSATEGVHPQPPERRRIRFVAVLRRAPLAMLGSMTAGLTNSAFYAMMPAVCTLIGLTRAQLSWIMSVTVFSGLAAQWVVGSLSDRLDRTLLLASIVAATATLSGLIFFDRTPTFGWMMVKMGGLGALLFAVYPVSVARAHDVFEGRDTVAVSAGLLCAYSIGACVSPLLASAIMTRMQTPMGLFVFWLAVNGIFTVVVLVLRKRENVAQVAVADQVAVVPMKSTSPVVMVMDPRGGPRPVDVVETPKA
jgi:MFS family permease